MNIARRMSRGSVSVEVALLVPVLVLVAALATAGWRIWWAGAQVRAAAEAAARAASVQVSVAKAGAVVDEVVAADLRTAGLHCRDIKVDDNLTAVGLPPGVAGTVTVSVTCAVALDDLLVPGLPGSITVGGQAVESIDMFRSRGR
ncbi:MAG: pilus assembly protein [Propionibacteriaceae bacterium]|nr:pilus assembly protein [Propionibacteriaceae bacterium]